MEKPPQEARQHAANWFARANLFQTVAIIYAVVALASAALGYIDPANADLRRFAIAIAIASAVTSAAAKGCAAACMWRVRAILAAYHHGT